MATAISEATGLPIQTRASNKAYASGWDQVFGEKKLKDRVKLGVSPSTEVQNVDCRSGQMIISESDDV